MEKSRKPREESGKGPSRRVFLQHVAGTGLATVAGVALLPVLGEAGKGTTQVPTPTTGLPTATTGTTTGATATTGTTTTAQPVAAAMGSDAGALNFLLTLERLEAAFYNLNGNKPYLTAAPATTPTTTPTTTAGTTPTATTGTNTGTTAATTAGTTTGAATGTTTGDTAATSPTVAVPTGTGSNLAVLKSMVDEISAHENSHVALLEQTLGTNATAAPTFQNLDAPTLQQFLTMAQTFEDVGVSAYEGQIPLIQDTGILATLDGIQAVEGRHAGGLRAYRKLASTAEGGDPNTLLTEDGQAVNPSRTMDQVLALVSPYVVGGTTTTTPTTATTATTTPTVTTGTTTPTATTATTTPTAATTGSTAPVGTTAATTPTATTAGTTTGGLTASSGTTTGTY